MVCHTVPDEEVLESTYYKYIYYRSQFFLHWFKWEEFKKNKLIVSFPLPRCHFWKQQQL